RRTPAPTHPAPPSPFPAPHHPKPPSSRRSPQSRRRTTLLSRRRSPRPGAPGAAPSSRWGSSRPVPPPPSSAAVVRRADSASSHGIHGGLRQSHRVAASAALQSLTTRGILAVQSVEAILRAVDCYPPNPISVVAPGTPPRRFWRNRRSCSMRDLPDPRLRLPLRTVVLPLHRSTHSRPTSSEVQIFCLPK
ncbi:hypothetical protein PVAP13_5NG007708, partial [Panicum virgatum]